MTAQKKERRDNIELAPLLSACIEARKNYLRVGSMAQADKIHIQIIDLEKRINAGMGVG